MAHTQSLVRPCTARWKTASYVGIVDINLTGVPAYDIADELKRQSIPFAFATGYAPEDIPAWFADVPCWRKPLVEGVIVDGLAELRVASTHLPP